MLQSAVSWKSLSPKLRKKTQQPSFQEHTRLTFAFNPALCRTRSSVREFQLSGRRKGQKMEK